MHMLSYLLVKNYMHFHMLFAHIPTARFSKEFVRRGRIVSLCPLTVSLGVPTTLPNPNIKYKVIALWHALPLIYTLCFILL